MTFLVTRHLLGHADSQWAIDSEIFLHHRITRTEEVGEIDRRSSLSVVLQIKSFDVLR